MASKNEKNFFITEKLRQQIEEKTLLMSQKELSQLFEVSQSEISLMINGKRKMSLYFVNKLHEKLGIDYQFIFENLVEDEQAK